MPSLPSASMIDVVQEYAQRIIAVLLAWPWGKIAAAGGGVFLLLVALFAYAMLLQERKAFPTVRAAKFIPVVVGWMIGSLVFSILSVPIHIFGGTQRGRYAAHLMSSYWARRLMSSLSVPEVVGVENLPGPDDGPVVFVMNHCSTVDVCTFYYCGNRKFIWVAKSSVFMVPGVGSVMRASGYVSIKRGSRDSVKQMFSDCRQRLKEGWSVAMFPQGTRRRLKILDFKSGAFNLAVEAGVPVVPMTIFLPEDTFFIGRKGPSAKITVHPMLKPGDADYGDPEKMTKICFDRVVGALPYAKAMLENQAKEADEKQRGENTTDSSNKKLK